MHTIVVCQPTFSRLRCILRLLCDAFQQVHENHFLAKRGLYALRSHALLGKMLFLSSHAMALV